MAPCTFVYWHDTMLTKHACNVPNEAKKMNAWCHDGLKKREQIFCRSRASAPCTWPPARAHGARSPLGNCSAAFANVAACPLATCSRKALSNVRDYVENERVVWRMRGEKKSAYFRPRPRHEEEQWQAHLLLERFVVAQEVHPDGSTRP